jgi:exosortase A-associated hydrolase 1
MNAVADLPLAAEEALLFPCAGESLVGILHRPAPGAEIALAATGIVVIVGGPQYRAGSHRQFVHLARALAAAGHPVLRFDVRGMGDAGGAQRSFEHIADDVGAAVDALQARLPGVHQVALWGLCDGASAALLYLHERRDPRIAGLCLLNPWVRSEASLARTHVKHYYTRRLRERAFWVKLFSGQVAGGALRDLIGSLRRAGRAPATSAQQPFQARMATAWRRFEHDILVLLSGDDYTAREFDEFSRADPAWRALLARPKVRRVDLPTADHTLSTHEAMLQAERHIVGWLAGWSTGRAGPAAA